MPKPLETEAIAKVFTAAGFPAQGGRGSHENFRLPNGGKVTLPKSAFKVGTTFSILEQLRKGGAERVADVLKAMIDGRLSLKKACKETRSFSKPQV